MSLRPQRSEVRALTRMGDRNKNESKALKNRGKRQHSGEEDAETGGKREVETEVLQV